MLKHLNLNIQAMDELAYMFPSKRFYISEIRILYKTLDTIPEAFGEFKNLERIALNYNGLDGKFPTSIGQLENLKDLSICKNYIEGEVPPCIRNLTHLNSLTMSTLSIQGSIPSWISDLKGLSFLDLSGSKFQGPIPEGLASLSQLTYLNLSENNLDSELPPFIGNLINLEILILNQCGLFGILPDEISNLQSLQQFEIKENEFIGPFPKCILQLKKLTHLDIRLNKFTGYVPTEINNLVHLKKLSIGTNNFRLPMPEHMPCPNNMWDFYSQLPYTYFDFQDIMDKSIYDNGSDIAPPEFLFDATIEFRGPMYKIHEWIFDARFRHPVRFTKEQQDLLNRIHIKTTEYLLRWIYIDYVHMYTFLDNPVLMAINYGEMACIMKLFRGTDESLEYWMNHFKFNTVATVRNNSLLDVIEYFFKFPFKEIHQFLGHLYRYCCVLTEKNTSNREEEIEGFLKNVEKDLSDEELSTMKHLSQKYYMDLKGYSREMSIDAPLNTTYYKSIMQQDLNYSFANKAFSHFKFEWTNLNVIHTYVASILWAQCPPLRCYITDKIGKVDMTHTGISPEAWDQLMHAIYTNSLEAFKKNCSNGDLKAIDAFLFDKYCDDEKSLLPYPVIYELRRLGQRNLKTSR